MGEWAGGEAAQRLAEARFPAAHRALLEDPGVQFALARTPPPAKPPAWLEAVRDWVLWALSPIGRALAWVGSIMPDWPYARLLLCSVIALFAAGVVWMTVERVRYGEWRWPRRRRRGSVAAPMADDAPLAAMPVRAWLEEADGLAARGAYAQAAHLLLFRSVEDLGRRRPGAVRPALTARELAAAPAFPAIVREKFATIAALVERSLFGGRPVDAADWQAARASYAELVLPQAWRR